jgi:predicted TPR repeat methyltransferase
MTHRNQEISFYLSREKARGFYKNLPKAILGKISRLSKRTGQHQTELVRDFFYTHRDAPNDVDLADHSTGHLDQMTSYVLDRDGEDFQTMVDVGCGNGALRLKSKSKRYIGVDLHISTNNSENVYFVQSTFADANINPYKIGSSSFYVVNCLCYVKEIGDIGNFIKANMSSGDVLNIIEPANAFWWETDFNGIRVYVRSQKEIKRYLLTIGLILEESAYCYLDRLLPFSPFSVFQAHRFKKR